VELTREALASPEVIDRGRTLFSHQCAVCHGDGRGNGPRAARLASRPADLTGPTWQRGLAPRDVYRIIRDGVPGTDMPSWTAMRPEDLAALTAFVLSLDGSPGVADIDAGAQPEPPPEPTPEPTREPTQETTP